MITFDSIRKQEVKKIALKEKTEICGKLVSELHQLVTKEFENTTKLLAKDHWPSLRKTSYFSEHTSNVCTDQVTIEYVIRKKSFFKNAIILCGTVMVDSANCLFLRVQGPAVLDITILNKYINYLSTKIAQIKEESVTKEPSQERPSQKYIDKHFNKTPVKKPTEQNYHLRRRTEHSRRTQNSSLGRSTSPSQTDSWLPTYTSSSSCSSSSSSSSDSSSSCSSD